MSLSNGDIYSSFAELKAAEPPGAFSIDVANFSSSAVAPAVERASGGATTKKKRHHQPTILIFAPHGGRIELCTTEIAKQVARHNNWLFYSFIGQLTKNNRKLHITSTNFDEPRCLELLSQSDFGIAIHGTRDDPTKNVIFVGGLLREVAEVLAMKIFPAKNFEAVLAEVHLAGKQPDNICNRGMLNKGVQLELTIRLREELVQDWARMKDFADCLLMAVEMFSCS